MNLDTWLAAAQSDAETRGLLELGPLLETLARSTAALRAADDEHRRRLERESAPPSPRA
jgi:hypothetical protein